MRVDVLNWELHICACRRNIFKNVNILSMKYKTKGFDNEAIFMMMNFIFTIIDQFLALSSIRGQTATNCVRRCDVILSIF